MMAEKQPGQVEKKRGLCSRCGERLGLLRRRGEGLLLTRRFLYLCMAVLLLLLGGMVGFVLYSSTPAFCGSCHVMDPYVASWQASSHHNVACIKCHFAPGWRNVVRSKFLASKYVANTLAGVPMTKPHAEIEDASCLRDGCHETRLIKSQVLFKGTITFDHARHLGELRRGKQLRCTSCHSQIVQGQHLAVTESVCFTCHFKGQIHDRLTDPIAGCTGCHSKLPKSITLAGGQTFKHQPFVDRKVACWRCHSDSVQGTGEVPRQVCLNCHSEPDKLEKYSDPAFMHDWHVTKRKVECFQCHSEIRHGQHPEPVAVSNSSCAACHSGDHGLQAELYSGKGGLGVEKMPSAMFVAGVGCIACHEMPNPAKTAHGAGLTTFEADPKACVECHGGAYKNMLGQWQETLGEDLGKAKAALAKAEAAYQQQPDGPQKAKAGPLLEVARHNCEFVEKARGVHNIDYATELLKKASDNLAEVLRLTAPAVEQPKTSKGDPGGPGATDNDGA
jgi:nitrate/TMAO reductase-like tetraheme cytochrome c subunit